MFKKTQRGRRGRVKVSGKLTASTASQALLDMRGIMLC